MPTTRRQLGFAAMSKGSKGRAKLRAHGKEPLPRDVASEMVEAARGKHFPPEGSSKPSNGYGR